MERREKSVSVNETHIEVPEGVRRARLAFLRDFASLLSDRKTRGKYVCYHNDDLVAVVSNYRAMIREVIARNIPEDASLIIKVTPGAGREQQLFADEAEIDPD
jgi:hypothetical protein